MISVRFRADLRRNMCLSSPYGYDLRDIICRRCENSLICANVLNVIQYVRQVSDPSLLPEYMTSIYREIRTEADKRFKELSR